MSFVGGERKLDRGEVVYFHLWN